jgi:hypothetical protein
MKATCKLCGAVIESEPDAILDEGRDQRTLTAFWNRLAYHVNPESRQCTPTNLKLVRNRFAMTMQDNGWFQRWRLLACVTTVDPKLVSKQEEWREYLHTITSLEASRAIESTEPEETGPGKSIH